MGNMLSRIKEGTKNHVDVEFPGSGEMIRINVLTSQDILDASMEADRVFRAAAIEVSMQNIRAYESEKEIQYLYRSCRDMDGQPLAPSVSDFRKLLTANDKEWLTEQYNALDTELNPSLNNMTDAEFDALVESVKKNPMEALSNVSSIYTLKKLALFLASAPQSSQTDSGRT